jgi:hypothetical protein
MRARDLCQALDLPILPKNTGGIRSRLKRLVSRGIRTEAEPGLFTRPGATTPSPRPVILPQPQSRNGQELTFRTLQ